MDIHTVKDRLVRTIKGKKMFLAEIQKSLAVEVLNNGPGTYAGLALESTSKFLEISVRELESMLKDVEVCCQRAIDNGCWCSIPIQIEWDSN
jgi:hypothetical protein